MLAPGTNGPDRLTVRKLWSPLALADEAQREHLRRLDAAHAQVRISSAPLPHETIILDRRVAILAGQPSPLGRRLGTSLRTYRRRVAELMTALESGSRFQAGVRASKLGLTH